MAGVSYIKIKWSGDNHSWKPKILRILCEVNMHSYHRAT
jgi:hypothetical protein